MTIDKAFPKPLKAKYISKGVWELIAPFQYHNPPIEAEVPIGFKSDGASIPQIAFSLIGGPWTGRYAKSALIHDYMYWEHTYTRYKIDRMFLEMMTILGVPWWRRWLMYQAVRLFGWIPWRNYNKKKLIAPLNISPLW